MIWMGSSASTGTSNTSISNSTFVAMDTDSCESDAAEELLPPYLGKHRTTDGDFGPSKRCKYVNFISMKPSHLRRHLETNRANLKNKPLGLFE
jgi:hypothetical protein